MVVNIGKDCWDIINKYKEQMEVVEKIENEASKFNNNMWCHFDRRECIDLYYEVKKIIAIKIDDYIMTYHDHKLFDLEEKYGVKLDYCNGDMEIYITLQRLEENLDMYI